MKVVIPVVGTSAQSVIDTRFGRCKFFALADTESGDLSFLPYEEKERGSGINAANFVLNLQPNALVVTNIGPKAFQVLDKAGIAIYEGDGTIEKIIDSLQKKELKLLTTATK